VLRLADLSKSMDAAKQDKRSLRPEDLVECFIRPYFEPGFHGAARAVHPPTQTASSDMTQWVFVQHLDPLPWSSSMRRA
jgi:hypothetical protein